VRVPRKGERCKSLCFLVVGSFENDQVDMFFPQLPEFLSAIIRLNFFFCSSDTHVIFPVAFLIKKNLLFITNLCLVSLYRNNQSTGWPKNPYVSGSKPINDSTRDNTQHSKIGPTWRFNKAWFGRQSKKG
jgi:hypothetical protein